MTSRHAPRNFECHFCAARVTSIWWRMPLRWPDGALIAVCAACKREKVYMGKRGRAFSQRRQRNLDGVA